MLGSLEDGNLMKLKDVGEENLILTLKTSVTAATLYQTDGGGYFPILLNVYFTTYIIEFRV